MLSNYNIKYICTIHTRLDTCRMSISRFSLRDKVTLLLLKLHFYGADVVEWSRALDIRLRDCTAVYQWCDFKCRRGKKNNLRAQKYNSNTAWFNFQTDMHIYIYIEIYQPDNLMSNGSSRHYDAAQTK